MRALLALLLVACGPTVPDACPEAEADPCDLRPDAALVGAWIECTLEPGQCVVIECPDARVGLCRGAP